jgi:hypothetical protein
MGAVVPSARMALWSGISTTVMPCLWAKVWLRKVPVDPVSTRAVAAAPAIVAGRRMQRVALAGVSRAVSLGCCGCSG